MSPQIIPLKGRKICGDPAEFWRQRLFAFELRRWEAQLEPSASISAEGARAVRVRLQGLNCHSGHRAQVEGALTVARLMREAGSPTSLTKRKRGREATLNA
jgi:hypothetical protein